jgi:hypothetical protein
MNDNEFELDTDYKTSGTGQMKINVWDAGISTDEPIIGIAVKPGNGKRKPLHLFLSENNARELIEDLTERIKQKPHRVSDKAPQKQ